MHFDTLQSLLRWFADDQAHVTLVPVTGYSIQHATILGVSDDLLQYDTRRGGGYLALAHLVSVVPE
jgi:predicted Rdx family selenoprotein